MKKINKLILATCVALSFTVAPMFSQVESKAHYSNGFKSTAETIRTDVEDYLDVRYFNNLTFDKVFLTTNLTKTGFNVGFATKKNDLYLSGFYNGGFWYNLGGNYNNNTESESYKDVNDATQNQNESIDVKRSNPYSNGSNHRSIFMIGFPNDMGLKLDTWFSFNSSSDKTKEKETASDGNNNSFESLRSPKATAQTNINNEYEVNLVWSCFNLDAGKTKIKPWARVGMDIYDINTKTYYETFTKENYPENPDNNVDEVEKFSELTYDPNNRYMLNLNLGSDFAWSNDNNFNQTFILDYKLTANFYNKNSSEKFESFTDNINKDNSETNETIVSVDGKKNFTNSLNGTYKFEIKPIENLTVAGRVGLGTDIRTWANGKTKTTVKHTEKDNNWVTVDGVKISENDVTLPVTYPEITENEKDYHVDTSINTSFGIGVKYAIKPSFVLNLGYSGVLPKFTINSHITSNDKTTKYDPDGNNVTTTNEKGSNITTSTSSYSSEISTGFTWTMSDCCALDVGLSVSRNPSLKEVWNAGWNLGFTFRK